MQRMRKVMLTLVLACCLLALSACPAGPATPGSTGTTGGSGGQVPDGNPNYDPGPIIEGGGSTLADTDTAVAGRTPAGSGMVELTSTELTALIRRGGLTEGETYRLTDAEPVSFTGVTSRTTDFMNIVVLASSGIVIEDCYEATFRNLTWICQEGTGGMQIRNSEGTVLEGVEIVSAGSALQIDAASTGLRAEGCRFEGATGADIAADSAVLLSCGIFGGNTGLVHSGSRDLYVENCRITAEQTAVQVRSSDSRVWYSTLTTGKQAAGGIVAEEGTNLLFAMNRIGGGPVSVSLHSTVNAVVILNGAVGVYAENSISTTLSDNRLSGSTELRNCRYVLANGNEAGASAFTAIDSEQLSGDNLTDVDARVEVGVNEELLPKVNKELFVGMERKTAVREITGGDARDLVTYLNEESRTPDALLIVAPGAYSVDGTLDFDDQVQNVTIYAYGVLLEKESYATVTMSIGAADHLTIKGIALDHAVNSTGQGVVIAKRAGGEVDIVAGAGMPQDWTDTTYYRFEGLNSTTYGYREGHPEPYADMGPSSVRYNPTTGIITLTYGESVANMIRVGDTITCRGYGAAVTNVDGAIGLYFEDVTVYGGAGFALRESNTREGTVLLRMLDTTGPAPIISEEEYNRYRELEERYGVSFGVYIDEEGRYRGTPPWTSSVDATHSIMCEKGLTAISCVFESMCDDGTNQRGAHGRMAGYTDNGDGTLTIRYKSNLSSISLSNGGKSGGTCAPFEVGDRVFIYTSAGRLLCDTEALSATREVERIVNIYGGIDTVYEIKVALEDFDLEGIGDIDLSSAVPTEAKICVDNMSRSSNGFHFENTLVQNIRSRGLLIKGSDGVIRNCSFINIGMGALAIRYEIEWGESGVSENLEIVNNYVENGGHYGNQEKNSPLSVYGLGRQAEDEYLNYKNIRIEGNHFIDRNTNYAIYINSAREVYIRNNVFGERKGEENDSTPPIRIDCAKDVEISGNQYPAGCSTDATRVSCSMNRHVYGSDLENVEDDPIFGGNIDAFQLNLPVASGGGVRYNGNWMVGYTSVQTPANFVAYTQLASSGWLCMNANSIWGATGKGGIWLDRGLGFAAQQNANVAICYTAPESGTYQIHITSYLPPNGDGPGDGYFAIATNDRVVWPAQGDESYGSAQNYYPISKDVTLAELQADLGDLRVTLEAGERLYFVAKYKSSWSNYTVMPAMVLLDE